MVPWYDLKFQGGDTVAAPGMGSQVETKKEASPLAVSTYIIRQVPFDAPYNWLAADFETATNLRS